MNYTMGRYLDEATDAKRDRVIRAKDFVAGSAWWDDLEECGCLVGTAVDGDGETIKEADPEEWERFRATIEEYLFLQCVPWSEAPASLRFPLAVARFGLPRIARAIKLRAAQGMTTEALTERDGAGLLEPEVVVG